MTSKDKAKQAELVSLMSPKPFQNTVQEQPNLTFLNGKARNTT